MEELKKAEMRQVILERMAADAARVAEEGREELERLRATLEVGLVAGT